LAFNANRAVPDYFQSGRWEPRATISTLANAMDVGNPSNMERLIQLFPSLELLKENASAYSVQDDEIKESIRTGKSQWDRVWCPHSAAASFVRRELKGDDWIIVATAHPSKFKSVVEPLVGEEISFPETMIKPSKHDSPRLEIEGSLKSLTFRYLLGSLGKSKRWSLPHAVQIWN